MHNGTHRERVRTRGEKWSGKNFIGILLFELCIYGITFWFIWNVYRSLFAHSTYIYTHIFFFVCAVLVCRFRYLYLLHRWNVHREIGFWCANAIKMEANQSNKKEKKLRLLYRHDLLFLGLNPHLYRIVLTFARLLCVVDVFSFHSLSLFCQVLFG